MNTRYIVRFIRSDDLPDEEYHYWNIADARAHYELFRHDDSCLYLAIQLIEQGADERLIEITTLLGLSPAEKKVIYTVGCSEQFDTCLRLIQVSKLLSDEEEKEIATTARIRLANLSPGKYPVFFSMLKKEVNI